MASNPTRYKPAISILLVLTLAIVMVAISITYSVFSARQLTSQVQELKAQQNKLNVEWGRLQLENSTWGAYRRVEKMASKKLDMIHPDASQRVVVNL